MKSISEIKELLQGDVDEERLREFLDDSRKGVQKLITSYMKRMEKAAKERLRVEGMYEKEETFYREGRSLVCGIDEVGRGPLAGPVTVAAVILPPHWYAPLLNDSKKVTPAHREALSVKIQNEAIAYSIVDLPPEDIDSYNIYQATMLAMYRAVSNLSVKPEAVIVDAMPLHFDIPTLSLVHGDAISASVAAASILAKVHRDHIMDEYDTVYPQYGFKQNKGYGTKQHLDALSQFGITPIHRKSFEPVKSMFFEKEDHSL